MFTTILFTRWPAMSAMFVIIDGYNLMHAAGLARATYGPGDLARKRWELLVKLARRMTIEERKRCTVVFDAIDAPPKLPGRYKHEEMSVLFAEAGHEADELIERLIAQHSAPRRLTVVSSDHRLQKAIARRKGIGLDSEVFLKQIESPDRPVGPSRQANSIDTNSETDLRFWLEEFDDVVPKVLSEESLETSADPKSDWDRGLEQLQQRLQNSNALDEWLNESDKRTPPPKPPKK